MPFSAGCLSLEPEKVMVTCRELHRLSSLPGAVSSDAIPDTEQRWHPLPWCPQSCCPQESHGWAQPEGQEEPRAPGWGWAPRG